MYFTKFHKSILKLIWEKRDLDSKNHFNLEVYMEFCYKWYKKKYDIKLYKQLPSFEENYVYSGYDFLKDKKYFIKREREIILAFKELESLLKHLNENSLINIQVTENPKCIPLFKNKQNSKGLEDEPFIDALKIVRDYIGKDIIIREGYRKFRRFNYSTHEEKLRFLITVWIPIVSIIITVILKLIYKR